MAVEIAFVTPERARRQTSITLDGSGFGATQGTSTVTVGGTEAEITSWSSNQIVCTVPDVNRDGLLTVTVTVGAESDTISLRVLRGDRIAFVDSETLEERLDVNNGGCPADGTTVEYWKQDGTEFPLPVPELEFEQPDFEDGGELIHDRMPHREITLVLLVTADSKTALDGACRALYAEVLKKSNCIEYQPEGATEPLYYTTYLYKAFEQPEYFRWVARQGYLAGKVTIKLTTDPWALGGWETCPVLDNACPEGSFEEVTGSGTSAEFAGWTKEVSGAGSSVGLTTTQKWDGSNAVEFITGAVAGAYAKLTSSDFKYIDPSKPRNIQIMGWKVSGTVRFSLTVTCYDSEDNVTGTLAILSEDSPTGAAWEEMVELLGEPVIHPWDSGLTPCWPSENTVKYKTELKVDSTGSAQDVYIDALLMCDTEYTVRNKNVAAQGWHIPPGVVKGDVPAPMDVYFTGAWTPGPWGVQQSDFAGILRAVSAVDETNVIAVGDSGYIFFFDGAYWAAQTSGVSDALYAVSALDAANAWAVGASARILYSDGVAWAAQAFPGASPVLPDPGFEGTFATYWDTHKVGGLTTETIDRFAYASPHGGTYCLRFWIINNTGHSVVLDDYAWGKAANRLNINVGSTYTLGLWQIGPTEAASPGITRTLEVLFYDAGGTLLGTRTAATFGATNVVWTQRTGSISPPYPVGTASIAVKIRLSGTIPNGWAMASEYYDDITITRTSTPALRGVEAITATNILAVGDYGTVVESSDGATWVEKNSGVVTRLRAVVAIDATRIWAIGDDGTILFSADGDTWTPYSGGTTEDLYGVAAVDASNVWAVGDNGTVLFWNGSAWAAQTSGTTENFRSVTAVDATHVWAVTEGGGVFFFTGTAWEMQASGLAAALMGACAIDATHVWAVGNDSLSKGIVIFGLSSVRKLGATDLILGQRERYSEDFDPVREAVDGALVNSPYRNLQKYSEMGSGETEKWLFNVDAHRGRYLVSVGACLKTGATDDTVELQYGLETVGGQSITPSVLTRTIDLSEASGGTAIEYWREIAMLVTDKFESIELPTHFTSRNANEANMNQAVTIVSADDDLLVDCISIIPTDRAYVAVKEFGATGTAPQFACMILDGHSHFVLAATVDSLDSAMVYDGTKWDNAPMFEADPGGMNLTLVAAYLTGTGNTQDYKLAPRLNAYFRYRPRYLLVSTD